MFAALAMRISAGFDALWVHHFARIAHGGRGIWFKPRTGVGSTPSASTKPRGPTVNDDEKADAIKGTFAFVFIVAVGMIFFLWLLDVITPT